MVESKRAAERAPVVEGRCIVETKEFLVIMY